MRAIPARTSGIPLHIIRHVCYLAAVIVTVASLHQIIYYAFLNTPAMPHCSGPGCEPYDRSLADAAHFASFAVKFFGIFALAGYLLSLPVGILPASRKANMDLRFSRIADGMANWAIIAYLISGGVFFTLLIIALSGAGSGAP